MCVFWWKFGNVCIINFIFIYHCFNSVYVLHIYSFLFTFSIGNNNFII